MYYGRRRAVRKKLGNRRRRLDYCPEGNRCSCCISPTARATKRSKASVIRTHRSRAAGSVQILCSRPLADGAEGDEGSSSVAQSNGRRDHNKPPNPVAVGESKQGKCATPSSHTSCSLLNLISSWNTSCTCRPRRTHERRSRSKRRLHACLRRPASTSFLLVHAPSYCLHGKHLIERVHALSILRREMQKFLFITKLTAAASSYVTFEQGSYEWSSQLG
jgi:hypothetical protein